MHKHIISFLILGLLIITTTQAQKDKKDKKEEEKWDISNPKEEFRYKDLEEGHEPSPEEAKERLYHLQEHGETPYAFSFKSKFTSEEALRFQKL